MNNVQENQLGMFLKVRSLMLENQDELQAQVTALENVIVSFDSLLTQLLEKASRAQEDISGTAERKANTRLQMEELALKVARGLWAYAVSINDVELTRACDLKRSDFTGANDPQLYLMTDRLHKRAQQYSSGIAAFTIATADITQLGGLIGTFLAQSEEPKLRIERRKLQNEEVQDLFERINELLTDKMDVYMGPLEFSLPALFALYSSARSVDNNSTGSISIFTGTVAGEQTLQVFNRGWRDTSMYSFANTGNVPLEFALSSTADLLEGTVLTVPAGSTVLKLLSSFGSTAQKLWVRNTGSLSGSYRVREL